MFYVSEGKIYGMTLNDEGKYEEYKVADGTLELVGKQLDHKPENRQVCTYEEVLAKFGSTKAPATKAAKEEPVVAKKSKS